MKKGQGLSMNVIIITAIALLILVILTTLLLRSGSILGGADACNTVSGAYCANYDEGEPRLGCDEGYTANKVNTCEGNPGDVSEEDREEICCIPLDD